MMGWFNKLLNKNDNSVDATELAVFIYAILSLGSVVVFLLLSVWDTIILKNAFHPNEYGMGIGAVMSGTGLGALFHTMKRFNINENKDRADPT